MEQWRRWSKRRVLVIKGEFCVSKTLNEDKLLPTMRDHHHSKIREHERKKGMCHEHHQWRQEQSTITHERKKGGMHHKHHQWRQECQWEHARGRRKSARAWEDLTLSGRPDFVRKNGSEAGNARSGKDRRVTFHFYIVTGTIRCGITLLLLQNCDNILFL